MFGISSVRKTNGKQIWGNGDDQLISTQRPKTISPDQPIKFESIVENCNPLCFPILPYPSLFTVIYQAIQDPKTWNNAIQFADI